MVGQRQDRISEHGVCKQAGHRLAVLDGPRICSYQPPKQPGHHDSTTPDTILLRTIHDLPAVCLQGVALPGVDDGRGPNMLCSGDTVGMSMATDTCAAQEQEATGAAPVHMDTELCGDFADTADDYGE